MIVEVDSKASKDQSSDVLQFFNDRQYEKFQAKNAIKSLLLYIEIRIVSSRQMRLFLKCNLLMETISICGVLKIHSKMWNVGEEWIHWFMRHDSKNYQHVLILL